MRITAPSTLGRLHLLAALRQVALAHPGITLDIRLSDQIADVVDDEIDIGLRLGMFRDQRLVARMTTRVGFHVVGTPELVARVGKPADLAGLARAAHHRPDRPQQRPAWLWLFRPGRAVQPALSGLSYRRSGNRDGGDPLRTRLRPVARLPRAAHLRSGRLVVACWTGMHRHRGACISIARAAARCRCASGWCSTRWWPTSPARAPPWRPELPFSRSPARGRRQLSVEIIPSVGILKSKHFHFC
ncbi:LysR substrate-binding domain-containing protein [Cupriavidus basilensis]